MNAIDQTEEKKILQVYGRKPKDCLLAARVQAPWLEYPNRLSPTGPIQGTH